MLEMIAKRKQDYLDKLPQDIPGQIKGLSEYDFMDHEAREKFKELMDEFAAADDAAVLSGHAAILAKYVP